MMELWEMIRKMWPWVDEENARNIAREADYRRVRYCYEEAKKLKPERQFNGPAK